MKRLRTRPKHKSSAIGRQPPDSSIKRKGDDDAKESVGLHPPLAGKVVYRLPTEAEWVHACRAGSVFKHVVGPEPQDLAFEGAATLKAAIIPITLHYMTANPLT